MRDGWIKLHRKFLEWEWWDDAFMVKAFIYLIMSANTEDKEWHGRIIHRGEFVTGRVKLAEELGMTERRIRTTLERLKSTGEIKLETTNKFTVITICKYESYQVFESQNDQQTTNKRPTKRPTNDQQNIYENGCVSNSYKIGTKANGQQTTSKTTTTKEYIFNNNENNARMREREFIKELKVSDVWKESMCMKHHVLPGEIDEWLDRFELDGECRGHDHDNITDVKQHFDSWLRIQIQAKKNEQGSTNRQSPASGAERDAAIDEQTKRIYMQLEQEDRSRSRSL